MSLDFDSAPDSKRWLKQVDGIRKDAALVPGIQSKEVLSVYLACTLIPAADKLGHDWGDAFVPSDITENLAWARNKVQLDPPDPALVRIQRELLTDDLHDALRRQN